MPLHLLNAPLSVEHEKEIQTLKNVGLIDITFINEKGKRKSVIGRIYETFIDKAYEKSNLLKDLKSGKIKIDRDADRFALPWAAMILANFTTDTIIPIVAPETKEQLGSYYVDALNAAKNQDCKYILLPMIPGKTYNCSYEDALSIATKAIRDWLYVNDMDILLLIYGRKTIAPPKALLRDLDSFLDNHYEFRTNPKYKGFFGKYRAFADKDKAEDDGKRAFLYDKGGYRMLADIYAPYEFNVSYSDPATAIAHEKRLQKLREEYGEKLDESFSIALIELINAKGKTAVEVYKRANIDRKLFSKIRNKFYIPGKRTTIALAVALELSIDETNGLLKRAGYTLSRSLMFDVIIEYFISKGKYDIYEINNVLFSYDQPILGE